MKARGSPANKICLPEGFTFSAACAGIKASGRPDLALVEACRDLLSAPLAAAAERIVECVMQDGKLLIGGLGSAAPDAERLTARLLHRFEMERPGLAAVNLGASLATMAGIVQDEGGEEVFARQVRSLGHTHDLLLLFCDDHRMLSQARAVEAAPPFRGMRDNSAKYVHNCQSRRHRNSRLAGESNC